MTVSLDKLLDHQTILLLQGKMGTYFCDFASFLMAMDKTVHKINFNYGDKFFYCHQNAYDYTDTLANFGDYLHAIIDQHNIGAVVCFNDCRPHHLLAKAVCVARGVGFFVFEEGYIRPDYITLQEGGVNGYSMLDFSQMTGEIDNDRPQKTHNRFFKMCLASAVYYVLCYIGQAQFPHYRHYRQLSIWQECLAWGKAALRTVRHKRHDKQLEHYLKNSGVAYFLVTLQVHNDTQISHHSDYADVREFIDEVIKSFAKYAHQGTKLVFKHHPLDRGHRNYSNLINQLGKQYNLSERLHYGTAMHLPTLIKASIGVVTINSTTALQAIYHKRPTKLTGRALYNLDRLTNQQSLDDFWGNPIAPDHEFYWQFRHFLIKHTQLNGSFYGQSPYQQAALYRYHQRSAKTNHDSSPPPPPDNQHKDKLLP